MVNIALFTEFYISQVVQDFFIPTSGTRDINSAGVKSHTLATHLPLCYRAKCGCVFPQVSSIQKNPAKQCIIYIYMYLNSVHIFVKTICM